MWNARCILKRSRIKRRMTTGRIWVWKRWKWISVCEILRWVWRTTTIIEWYVSMMNIYIGTDWNSFHLSFSLSSVFAVTQNLHPSCIPDTRYVQRQQWTFSSTQTLRSFWKRWNQHWKRNSPKCYSISWIISSRVRPLTNGLNRDQNTDLMLYSICI